MRAAQGVSEAAKLSLSLRTVANDGGRLMLWPHEGFISKRLLTSLDSLLWRHPFASLITRPQSSRTEMSQQWLARPRQ